MEQVMDQVALLLRALQYLPGLQALLLGLSAFLSGFALARVARRLRLYPTLPHLPRWDWRRGHATRKRPRGITTGL